MFTIEVWNGETWFPTRIQHIDKASAEEAASRLNRAVNFTEKKFLTVKEKYRVHRIKAREAVQGGLHSDVDGSTGTI